MKHGFTLVELLVTLGIITVLLSLSLAGINNARVRSRDAKRIADLRTIQSALEQHALGDPSHTYPPDPEISTDQNTAYCAKYDPAPSDPTKSNGREKGLYDNRCFTDFLAVVPLDPYGKRYEYHKPGCFVGNQSVVGGISLTNATIGCDVATNPSYGLHVALESANNAEAVNDVTPTFKQSFDLTP